MIINSKHITKSERSRLEKLIAFKRGNVTVKEARAWVTHSGLGMVWFILFGVAMFAALSLVFMPFLFFVPGMILYAPFKIAADNRKWLEVLPVAHDDEVLVIA